MNKSNKKNEENIQPFYAEKRTVRNFLLDNDYTTITDAHKFCIGWNANTVYVNCEANYLTNFH